MFLHGGRKEGGSVCLTTFASCLFIYASRDTAGICNHGRVDNFVTWSAAVTAIVLAVSLSVVLPTATITGLLSGGMTVFRVRTIGVSILSLVRPIINTIRLL